MALTFITQSTVNNLPTPATGSIFFDNSTGTFRIYDGTNWTEMLLSPDDIMEPQLITDELTFGNMTFYTVDPKNYDWDQIYIWCRETFGPPRDGIKVKETLNSKWFISGGTFHFHEKKHRDWLILRWTGNGTD